MKNVRTISVGLIISTWGIFHFVNNYALWLMNSKDYDFAVNKLYAMGAGKFFGFPTIFALGYVIFWLGIGLLVVSLLAEAFDKARQIKRRRLGKLAQKGEGTK